MANDFIPEAQAGEGAAPRGAPSMLDYRQLQSPAAVNTDLPSSGAAERAEALRKVFKDFEGVSSGIAGKVSLQAGALAGAASGNTGHPQYKEGLARLTTFGQAFNNAATAAYAVQAETQADDAAAAQRIAANKDPGTFLATYTATRDAVLKNAPALAVPMLTDLYNKRLAINLAAIRGDQLTEQRELQGKDVTYGIQRQTSRVATLQGSMNPHDQLEAQDEQHKLNLMIEGGVNSGLFSKADAEAMHINAMRTITEQVFSTSVDRELADPNGDVVGLMERFRLAHVANLSNPNEPTVLSQPEFDRLMSEAKQKVQQQRMMDYYGKANGKTAEQLRHEAGDREYTAQLNEGTLTIRNLTAAVRNEDITPEVERTLRNALLVGPVARDDPAAVMAVRSDPNHLDFTDAQMATLPGVTNATRIKLQAEFEHERRNWQGTPEAKQGKDAILAALKIRPGTERAMLSDEQRAQSDAAMQEYTTRMNAMDPAKRKGSALTTAQDVVHAVQQKNIQAQITDLQALRQSAVEQFGGQWDKKRMGDYLKQKDDAIAALQAQLGK